MLETPLDVQSAVGGVQKCFKNQLQGVLMGSKMHSGEVLEGQAEKKKFFDASRTP